MFSDLGEALSQAHEQASRLLGRRSAVRRTELAAGLQTLTEAVATAIDLLKSASDPETADTDSEHHEIGRFPSAAEPALRSDRAPTSDG